MTTSLKSFLRSLRVVLIASFALASCSQEQGELVSAKLAQEFKNPPNASRPRVWWHWMNGNITEHGIRKDLAWMNRVGIGGFQNFDANLFTPQVVEKKLVFMQPDWKSAFKVATTVADSLGLEMAIAGSPGWSVTGGPWVEPKDGMKKYVWTETIIDGGKHFSGSLPKLPDNVGAFQDVGLSRGGINSGFTGEPPHFAQDVAVFAYKLSDTEHTLQEMNPLVTSSGGKFTLAQLADGNLNNTTFLPPKAVGEDMWIQYAFKSPETFSAYSVVGASHLPLEEFNGGPENRKLKVSDDGVNFKDIATIPGSTVPQVTGSFAPTTAKYWRVTYTTLPGQSNPFAAMMGGAMQPPKPDGVQVAEFVLYNAPRIDQFEEKAGFAPWGEKELEATEAETAIRQDEVVDLTSNLKSDGSLDWEVPAGRWKVIRFGYSLTGRQNHPASPEATGLEVDKLDADAVSRYVNTYLDMYKDATGGLMGQKGLGFMVIDSYEAGHMNWTDAMLTEFEKRRGYSMKPWLPVLTGRVVNSRLASEKFLWDFRKTIGEMIAENHYDVIGEELHKRGMKRYTESHENKRIYLADGMDVKRNADIPMAAMWTPGSLAGGANEEPRSEADIRESASVANIYGKPFVAAESMTSIGNAFSYSPEKLKRTADLELASGLNRFVIHTSVHQPLDDKRPGFSLGPFGQYFTRQETWAEYAKPWMDYLARSSYLLQQGKNVADILYYYGENENITWICREKLPDIPKGFEFDFINSSALINAIHAENGKLVAQSGNTYGVLMLDKSARYMTMPVLKKIQELVEAGIKVVGERPLRSASQQDDDAAFQKMADEVWSSEGVVIFDKVGLQPDVIVSKTDHDIRFRHRKTDAEDIFWFNNRSFEPTLADVSLRISGKVPMLWNAQTGATERVSYRMEGDRTIIPMNFESWGAQFIVFGASTNVKEYTVPEMTETVVATIDGPWEVSFQKERGAPDQATFEALTSWSENEEPGIRYFSGTATYQHAFNVEKVSEGERYQLDLGDVKNIAEVVVNGTSVGILWKTPFRLDITDALKAGTNSLEVKVTNLWVNRLIGDAQPGVKEKITFTTMPFYRADNALLPSGLLGPVKVSVSRSNASSN